VISLIDVDGHIVNNSRVFPSRNGDFSDRDYFKRARDGNSVELFTTTVKNRFTERPTIIFSRRLESRGGKFLGVVLINVGPSSFRHVYESISTLTDRAFLFTRLDGLILVRHPEPKQRVGERVPAASPWYQAAANGGGYFRSLGAFDQLTRIVAVR